VQAVLVAWPRDTRLCTPARACSKRSRISISLVFSPLFFPFPFPFLVLVLVLVLSVPCLCLCRSLTRIYTRKQRRRNGIRSCTGRVDTSVWCSGGRVRGALSCTCTGRVGLWRQRQRVWGRRGQCVCRVCSCSYRPRFRYLTPGPVPPLPPASQFCCMCAHVPAGEVASAAEERGTLCTTCGVTPMRGADIGVCRLLSQGAAAAPSGGFGGVGAGAATPAFAPARGFVREKTPPLEPPACSPEEASGWEVFNAGSKQWEAQPEVVIQFHSFDR